MSCYLSEGVVITLDTVTRDVVTEVPGLTSHTAGAAVFPECSRWTLCLTLRPGVSRLTQTGPVNLSTETSVTAAALELTGLPPGPPGTASFPAADPSVARLTLTGEGGNAGSVFAVDAQWDTLTTIPASLSEPLATALHLGRVQGRIYQ